MTRPRSLRRLACAFGAAALLLSAPAPVRAQGCVDFIRHLHQSGCLSDPLEPKYSAASRFQWTNGDDYLAINNGNDLHLWRINNAGNPTEEATSDFSPNPIGNLGDSDYDLSNYSLCDGCRYGIANYRLASALFDLGTSSVPGFSEGSDRFEIYSEYPGGGFTFMHRTGTQYVLSKALGDDCSQGTPMYAMSGVDPGDLSFVACADPGFDFGVTNGFLIEEGGVSYLYLGDFGSSVLGFQVTESGGIGLQHLPAATFSTYVRWFGMDVQEIPQGALPGYPTTDRLALTVNNGTVRLYDVSDPASPSLIQQHQVGDSRAGSLGWPLMFLSRQTGSGSPERVLLDIEDFSTPSTPQPIDSGFWNPSQPWHSTACQTPNNSAFSPDGTHLYTTDYTSAKVIDVEECMGPMAPSARVELDSLEYFPGDEVTVTNDALGQYDECAIWIGNTNDYDDPAVLGTNKSMGTCSPLTDDEISRTIASDLAAGVDYWAFVAVALSGEFDCNPGSNPDACNVGELNQIAWEQITIDRAPEASISYVNLDRSGPPLTGDTVRLSASEEGHPVVSPYSWQIDGPGANDWSDTGSPVDVTLDETGQWAITLSVQYEHDDGGAKAMYTASTQQDFDVSSVAADFTVPTGNLDTESITFDSTSNAASGADLDFNWDLLNAGGTSVVNSLSVCDGSSLPVNASCTFVPKDIGVEEGSYKVRLRLTNTATDPDDVSEAIKDLELGDGDIQLDIGWIPSNPERGQTVIFSVRGVAGDLESASWNFGDTGCDSADRTPVCTPGPFTDCKSYAYAYADSVPSSKAVSLSVVVDGRSFGPVNRSVPVQSTGQCDDGGGGGGGGGGGAVPCAYTLSSYSNTFNFTGGQGQVNVNASSSQCTNSWSARSNSPGWIIITSGTSGNGPGTVRYTVDQNPTPARAGTLTVAGKTHTVNQTGYVNTDYTASNYRPERGETVHFSVDSAFDPVAWNFESQDCEGNSPVISCTHAPSLCRSLDWSFPEPGEYEVTFTSTTGSRTKSIWVKLKGECPLPCLAELRPDSEFSIAPSPIYAGDEVSFAYGEGPPPPCSYSLDPTSANVDADGESLSLAINTAAGCAWTGSSNSSWITITSSTSGTGPSQLSYTVAANPGDARSGVITVAGVSHTVTQEETPLVCSYTADPDAVTIPDDGGDGSFELTTDAECDWTAVSDSSWISVTSESAGTGPTTVSYSVEANAGDERTGNIVVNGAVHAITQEEWVQDTPNEKALAVGFTWDPSSPEIGQIVGFNLSGVSGDVRAEWDFDNPGCPGTSDPTVCEPGQWTGDCHIYTFKFSSGGPKTVQVTVKHPTTGAVIGSAQETVTVQSTGSCGGDTCSFNLSPSSGSFPIAGGPGSFNVNTAAGCAWTAQPNKTWITVSPGSASGEGSGTVNYTVAANGGADRSGAVGVQNKSHIVSQAGTGGGGGGGQANNEATDWLWTVTLNGEEVTTNTASSFDYSFLEPGLYTVRLDVSNCAGSRTRSQTFEVLPQLITEHLVAAAVHAPGLRETLWITDVKMYNPCDAPRVVTIEYLPEKTNNSGGDILKVHVPLDPRETRILRDVVADALGIVGVSNLGSLRFSYDGGAGCLPLVMSRTYNDTEYGTFGQFVQALPVLPVREGVYHFTGLAQSDDYRTNLGFANFGDKNVWNIKIRLLDKAGDQLGNTVTTNVPGYSTRQIVEVAKKAGLDTEGSPVKIFSAEIDINGGDISVYASVADQITGDPVLYWPFRTPGSTAWIPGIAHIEGRNDSVWRSDVIFFNTLGNWNKIDVEYIPSESGAFSRGLETNIAPWRTRPYRDVLVSMLNMSDDAQSQGYLIINDLSGLDLPVMAARTFNLATSGGTYGQGLAVFGVDDLLSPGDTGYIPGVSGSSSTTDGFRVNLGILNTRQDGGARVDIRVYDSDGTVAGELLNLWLPAGKSRLLDLFGSTGIGLQDLEVSVEVTVLSGGPVAIYASEADNRTQDPVFIPAIKKTASP